MNIERLYHCTIEHNITGEILRTVALYREDDRVCEVRSLTDQDRWYTFPVSWVVLGMLVDVPDELTPAEDEIPREWTWHKTEGWRCLGADVR